MSQLTLHSQKKLTFMALGVTTALVLSLSIGDTITPATAQPVARMAPASFGVQSIQMANGVGTAKINIDHFELIVLFDYSLVDDSNGALGGDFTDIAIDALNVARITDVNGNAVPDFTDRDDHLNIKNMLVAYMASNGLV